MERSGVRRLEDKGEWKGQGVRRLEDKGEWRGQG